MRFDAKRLLTRETQAGAKSNRSAGEAGHARPDNDTHAVCDTWPDQVPISSREVETIEIYLGRILDELLRTHGAHQIGKQHCP